MQSMHNIDLPVPNVYFVSIASAYLPKPIHLHIAGDFPGAVMRKVQRYCREQFHFVAHRGNTAVRMRRYRLKDYLNNPQGLLDAHTFAVNAGETDTALKLSQRPKEVAALYNLGQGPSIDADAVWALLEAEMAALEVAHG